MKILIVDDEKLVMQLLIERVRQLLPDAEIWGFTKATQAMEFIETHRPDIAFLDIQMNTLNGIPMAKMLHGLYPNVNIIFCTGYSEYAMDALKVYCSDYLLKPVRLEDLRRALANLRYPVEEEIQPPLRLRCFGEFSVLYMGEPLHFKYSRTLELLACLTVRNGQRCEQQWLNSMLFDGDGHDSYYRQLKKDLLDTMDRLGLGDIISSGLGWMSLDRTKVSCDYFDFMDGKLADHPEEFMEQYPALKNAK